MEGFAIGWIDFSKEQRNKVMSVLDLLREPQAVDELGVGIIRDAFADRFFPGTSTIQTRAKYFMIVPYLLNELENQKPISANEMIAKLEEEELNLINRLKEVGETGIIGQSAGKKLKRKPSNIYWNGIRKYGILKETNISLAEYANLVQKKKKENVNIKSLMNIKNKNEENEGDDLDAISSDFGSGFWKLPVVNKDWRNDLSIHLTKEEAEFLRLQIISSCPDSLMGFILKEKRYDFCMLEAFDEIENNIDILPEEIKKDYLMAKSFSDFIIGAHIRYNIILSKGEDEDLNYRWNLWNKDIMYYSSIDLNKIFLELNVKNISLKKFLLKCKSAMFKGNIDLLDEIIIKREKELKGIARAKLSNISEFEYKGWIGIKKLQYRLSSGQNIIKDIFKGIGEFDVKSF